MTLTLSVLGGIVLLLALVVAEGLREKHRVTRRWPR